MHLHTSAPALLLLLISLIILSPTHASPGKNSDDGVEFVRACDSGSDDVTNQCINRIPEDIGANSSNHACAYHEAEVKCLGLCGNTLTWKVAYINALKRYRLVCAGYIDERIAEKEESGEGGDPDSSNAIRKHKKKKAADEDDSGDAPAGDDADATPAKKKSKKAAIAFDMSALTGDSMVAATSSPEAPDSSSAAAKSQSKAAKPTKSDPAKSDPAKGKPSPKPTGRPSAKAGSGASRPASGKTQDDKKDDSKQSSRDSERDGKSSAKGQGLLPTMDPDMAGAGSLQAWSGFTIFAGLLALLSAL